jgi:predicted enzyme related to lactoylglutathione lyase
MPRVVHFEIACDQPERAREFYREVFGWKIDKWGGPFDYWLASTGEAGEPGIDGALTRAQPQYGRQVLTIAVPSVDAFLEKIEKSGGARMTDKMPIPGVGYHALFRDTEGNVLGVIENDPNAH